MATHYTPLKIWSWVGVLFILIQVVILFFFKLIESDIIKSKNEHYFDQVNYIQEEFKADTSNYKVIIIGSSLVAYGVECPEEIATYLSSEVESNLKLVKIWDSNDPLNRFIQNNLVNEIIEANPDLVLFQTELAAISFNEKNFITQNMLKLSSTNRTVLNYLIPQTKRVTYSSEIRCYPIGFDKQVQIDTLKIVSAEREIKKVTDLDLIFEAFSELKKAEIKTIIIDIPRPKQTENTIYTQLFKDELQQLLHIYKQDLEVEHWEYTGKPIYYKHCLDQAHLNKEGRNIYTKWLLEKIEKER